MNSFSSEWDKIYLSGQQLTSWPWSDVVSLIYRYCKDSISKKSVVFELGCGVGPNIPFIQSLGMNYYGIDGSKVVVNKLHIKYNDLKDQINVGDFTSTDCFAKIPDVDIIIDRAAVTHNNLQSIKNTLKNSHNALKSGGFFIGIDWFSTKHSDYNLGKKSGDKYTYSDIETGQFENIGNVHFSDEAHIRSLFSDFDIVHLSEKVINNYETKDNHQFASWNIVAKKK